MTQPKKPAPTAAPKPAGAPKEDHEESLLDEAEDESFPASDPNSETQPQPTKKQK